MCSPKGLDCPVSLILPVVLLASPLAWFCLQPAAFFCKQSTFLASLILGSPLQFWLYLHSFTHHCLWGNLQGFLPRYTFSAPRQAFLWNLGGSPCDPLTPESYIPTEWAPCGRCQGLLTAWRINSQASLDKWRNGLWGSRWLQLPRPPCAGMVPSSFSFYRNFSFYILSL